MVIKLLSVLAGSQSEQRAEEQKGEAVACHIRLCVGLLFYDVVDGLAFMNCCTFEAAGYMSSRSMKGISMRPRWSDSSPSCCMALSVWLMSSLLAFSSMAICFISMWKVFGPAG